MEIRLLYPEKEKEQVHQSLYPQKLIKDLKMERLLEKMCHGETDLYEICKAVLTTPLINEEAILWRQAVVKEAINYPQLFQNIYKLAKVTLERIEAHRTFTTPKYYQIIKNSQKLITEVHILEIFTEQIESLRQLIEEEQFVLEQLPMKQFKEEVLRELNETFIKALKDYLNVLKEVKERQNMTVTGHLFLGFKRADYILNDLMGREAEEAGKAKQWGLFTKGKTARKECISLADIGTENNVKELIEANLEGVFKLLSKFNKQLYEIFQELKVQFGFYSCSATLYNQLMELGVKCSFPEFEQSENKVSVEELVDIGLVLKGEKQVVGNSISVENKNLWLITGANQGGKTTFLRSIGLGTLMAQSGLFVSAASYKTKIFTGVFTHFPNEEDAYMHRGLLEVELEQLQQIIEVIQTNSLLLLNESFATTTEKEGSQIAKEVTKALRESGVITIFVTHLFTYADALYKGGHKDVICYSAQRGEEGCRTYQIKEGSPIEGGVGVDLI